jgi:3-oxoacyl-[acyl-carrier protein] reductase
MAEGLRIPDLDGRGVLVTGASTGIGAAVARALAAQGARVGLHYNASAAAAQALADDIAAAGGTAALIRADMSTGAGARAAVDGMAAAFGRIDGLINNAGGMVRRKPYAEAAEVDYDQIMDLNARSVIVATQAAFPHLKSAAAETGDAFVINTTSVAARVGGSAGAGLYGSSKAFVHAATKGMAREFIAHRIRVNAVAPGVIATPFHERYSTEAQLAAQLATIPAGRLGAAGDCVGAYLFLCSPALSGYVIGQVIEVNGGQLMP